MHPITLLQGALVTALRADPALTAIVGPDGVFDAPPAGRAPPYVVVLRHDIRIIDADLAPSQEHRLLLACWSDQPGRRRAVELAGRVSAVALELTAPGLAVTHRDHLGTQTVIDAGTGMARATVRLRFHSEGNT